MPSLTNIMLHYFSLVAAVLLTGSNAEIGGEDPCLKLAKALECCRKPSLPDDLEMLTIGTIGGSPTEKLAQLQSCQNKHMLGKTHKSVDDIRDDAECLVECALNGTKLINNDLTVNKKTFITFFEKDPEWKGLVEKTLDKCEEVAAKAKTETFQCKGKLLYFGVCLFESILKNCPKKTPMDDKPECKAENIDMDQCIYIKVIKN